MSNCLQVAAGPGDLMALLFAEGIKIVGALCFILAPGLLVTHALRLAKVGIQILPISVGLTLMLLTLFDIPLVCLHLNVGWLIPIWCALCGASIWLCWKKSRTQGCANNFGLVGWLRDLRRGDADAVMAAACWILLAVLSVCLFAGPGYIGGEEEIELIITRKILENPYITFDNTGHLPGLVPTYLLTPLYLFRALLSLLTGLDPVLAQYRLGFIPATLAILSLGSIVQVLTGSARAAKTSVILGALCALLAPLDTLAHSPFMLPGWYRVPNLPPPEAFYRATCSVQIATPICLLLLLMALCETQRWRLYAAAFILMLLTTVQIHAAAAVYVVGLLGLSLIASVLASGTCNPREILSSTFVRRSGMMVIAAFVMLLVYKQCFNMFHQDVEAIEGHQRQFAIANLKESLHHPAQLVTKFPESVFRYNYFKYRGSRYGTSQGIIYMISVVTPALLLGWLCSLLLFGVQREFRTMFLLCVFISVPIVLRLPLFSMLAFTLNTVVFNDVPDHLSFFPYIMLFLAAVAAGDAISKWLVSSGRVERSRLSVCGAVVLCGFASYFVLGGIAESLRREVPWGFSDRALGFYFVAGLCAIALVWLLGRRPWRWEFASDKSLVPALLAIALVLPMIARTYGGITGATVTRNFPRQLARVGRLKTEYDQYSQNIWPSSQLTPGLFDCLTFVRRTVPRQQMFAADPSVIRTVAMLSDQYVVHSGVPFDFVERYFQRYYKPTVSQDAVLPPGKDANDVVPYVAYDPFFQRTARLSPEALAEDAQFVRDFHVDYLLFTPAFHADTDRIFELLRASGVRSTKLYDRTGYALYHIEKAASG